MRSDETRIDDTRIEADRGPTRGGDAAAPTRRHAVPSARELWSRLSPPWLRRVDKLTLRADLSAGVLGALLVLPQGFAFASLADCRRSTASTRPSSPAW